jgi:Leucine-rich repeat (LRR) protein
MITATLTSTFTPAPTSTFTPVLTPTQNVTTLTDEEIVQRYFPDAEYHLQGDRVIILDLVLAQITSLSPEIRQLKRLGILYLQGNPITTLPPELERWRPNH